MIKLWALAVWKGSQVVERAAVQAKDTAEVSKIVAHLLARVKLGRDFDALTITVDHRREK